MGQILIFSPRRLKQSQRKLSGKRVLNQAGLMTGQKYVTLLLFVGPCGYIMRFKTAGKTKVQAFCASWFWRRLAFQTVSNLYN